MMNRIKGEASLSDVHESVDVSRKKIGWKRAFAFFGPAYLVSVGYMDPGNWATDLAGGSQFGYSLLWVLLMSNLMALLLQGFSARLAYNWRGEFTDTFDGPNAPGSPLRQIIVKPRGTLDASISYSWGRHFTVTLDAPNITQENYRAYFANAAR